MRAVCKIQSLECVYSSSFKDMLRDPIDIHKVPLVNFDQPLEDFSLLNNQYVNKKKNHISNS